MIFVADGKGEKMDDLISRNAVLSLAKNVVLEGGIRHRCIDATMIYELPSAQPEYKTCLNCGRTANNGGFYKDGRTRCPIEEHYALPKDGHCHLWEKRNVWEDEYPERREDG